MTRRPHDAHYVCVFVCGVCVCARARARARAWCLLPSSFLARAVLVGVVLWLATSHQMFACIDLPYANRISHGRSRSSGTTLWGLRDRMRSEHVWRY